MDHHKRLSLCTTRPNYRDGRKLKAVKVYTISQESKYLIITGIPKLPSSTEDLIKQLSIYGEITEHKSLSEYPCEAFTIAILIKYTRIISSRIAKRYMDDYNYLGGCLHVFYAPEYESALETQEKLTFRQFAVSRRIKQLNDEANSIPNDSSLNRNRHNNQKIVHVATCSTKNDALQTNISTISLHEESMNLLIPATNHQINHSCTTANAFNLDLRPPYSMNTKLNSVTNTCINLESNQKSTSIIDIQTINPNSVTNVNDIHIMYTSTDPSRLGGPVFLLESIKGANALLNRKNIAGPEVATVSEDGISAGDGCGENIIIRPSPVLKSCSRFVPRQLTTSRLSIVPNSETKTQVDASNVMNSNYCEDNERKAMSCYEQTISRIRSKLKRFENI